MKKMVLFLLMVLGTIGAIGQHKDHKLYPMIQPLKEGGYTISEFEHFVLAPTPLSVDYSDKLLSRINQFLRETGLDKNYNQGMPLDRRHISSLFQKVVKKYRVYPDGFWNSHQNDGGNKVVPYWDNRRFEGMVFTLCLGRYELDLGKSECDNFVNVPYLYLGPLTEEKRKKDTVWIEKKQESILFQDTPKKDFTNPFPASKTPEHNNKWVKWVVGGLVASVAATTYMLLNQHHHVDNGGPGGAPITPAVPVIPSTGGPGGAPTTK